MFVKSLFHISCALIYWKLSESFMKLKTAPFHREAIVLAVKWISLPKLLRGIVLETTSSFYRAFKLIYIFQIRRYMLYTCSQYTHSIKRRKNEINNLSTWRTRRMVSKR
jgi:hypothetical protein